MITVATFLQFMIAGLGLGVGEYFRYIVPEEKEYSKQFALVQHILYVSALAVTAYFYRNDWRIATLMGVLLLSYFLKKNRSTVWTYAILGVVLGITSAFQVALFFTAVIIFMFGIPTAMLRHHWMESIHQAAWMLGLAVLITTLL